MKYLLTTFTFFMASALTLQAQAEPYISYYGYSQYEYNVSVGSTWGIGGDNIDLTSSIGLTDRYVTFGSGVDVVSGNLLGIPLFIGAYLKYAVNNTKDTFIGTPKIGFRVPVSGSHVTLYTAVDSYQFNNLKWRPIGISISL